MMFEPKIRRKNTSIVDDTARMICFLAVFVCIGMAVSESVAQPKAKKANPELQKMSVTRKVLTKNAAFVFVDKDGDDVSDAGFWESFENGVPESYSNVVKNQTAEIQEWKNKFPKANWFFSDERQ